MATNDRSPDRRSCWRWLLAGSLVLGFTLRVWNLGAESLSSDELAELRVAARGSGEILEAPNGFPPLYHLVLRGWLDVFSIDPGARWLAALLGTATILVAGLLGRRLGSNSVGAWTALLLAISPFHIYYSQEARAYVLFVLLAAAALWLLFRALDVDTPPAWTAYALVATAGIYTHYYFSLIVALGVLLVLLERRDFKPVSRPALAHASIAALSLPLLSIVTTDFRFQAEFPHRIPFGIGAFGFTWLSLATGYTLGPSLRELHTMDLGQALPRFLPWLALMSLPVAILGYHGWHVLTKRARSRLAWFILAPVVAVGLIGIIGDVGYNVRYVAWLVVPCAVWVAAGATRWRRWPVAAALLVLAGLSTIALWNRHHRDRYRNEDSRALAAFVRAHPRDDTPLFVLSGYMAGPIRFYLDDDRTVVEMPNAPDDQARVSQALALIDARTSPGEMYWLAYTRAFHDDPSGAVKGELQRRHGLRPIARFAGAVLYQGVIPPTEGAPAPIGSDDRRSHS